MAQCTRSNLNSSDRKEIFQIFFLWSQASNATSTHNASSVVGDCWWINSRLSRFLRKRFTCSLLAARNYSYLHEKLLHLTGGWWNVSRIRSHRHGDQAIMLISSGEKNMFCRASAERFWQDSITHKCHLSSSTVRLRRLFCINYSVDEAFRISSKWAIGREKLVSDIFCDFKVKPFFQRKRCGLALHY